MTAFKTIVMDPPWDYGNKSGRHGTHYKTTMTVAEIRAWGERHFPSMIGESAHLYLWVTDAFLGEAYPLIEAWGFRPKASLVWIKDRIGMGNYFRHQHELCIFAARGKGRLNRRDASTIINAKNRGHSQKPDAFYALVESCSPGPYADIFARIKRPGWSVYGNEIASEYQQRLIGDNESKTINLEA